MKSAKNLFSFGRYLQSIRLEKKISLGKVSEETRIAIGNLQLIEKEDLEALPAEVFVRGFLRSFARAIGADDEEAVRLYQDRLNMEDELSDAGSFSGRSSLKPWLDLTLSVAVLLCLVALSLYGVSYFQNQVHMPETAETHVVSEDSKAVMPQEKPVSKTQKDSTTKPPEKWVLQITAIESTWIKLIIDNKDSKEYELSSGEHLEVEASAGYNLLIGNAGGLELKLNGEPVPISGKIGEVVSIQLP
ncbi:MAG: RodZ domain-containing protein [Desulfobacterales bacterium]